MLLPSIIKCLFACSVFPLAAFAAPASSDPDLGLEDDFDLLEARQSSGSYFPVTGIPGKVYPRLEISTMYNKQPDQWNLYLLALQSFKAVQQEGKFSFYQIAGIHGVPNVAWDGVTQNPPTGGIGYCTHDSVLFPAWHRPFVALYEMMLMRHVKKVVKTFPAGPQRNKYAAAAATMRVPYWDWAAAPPHGQPDFLHYFSAPYATVMTGQGKKTIHNPLYQYKFHPLNPGDMIFDPWASWNVSMRWPTSNQSTATSQQGVTQTNVDSGRINIRDILYSMYVNCPEYLAMSNDEQSSASPGCPTNLETIHGYIHATVGGKNQGHMAVLWYSAFDPVFFLHHAMVDRLFALWQAVYPDNYGASQVAPGSTYTIQTGSTQGPNSPLTPFHADASGNFWTTNGVRNWRIFGYTYPEFAESNGSPAAIRKYINKLYGPNATATAGSNNTKRGINLHKSSPLPADLLPKISTPSGALYEYFATVAAPRFALGGSYNVYVFMGGPTDEDDATQWSLDKNLVGTVNIFAQPHMEHLHVITTGSVPLTRSLQNLVAAHVPVNGAVLTNLDKSATVPFLQKALEWRVATLDGQIVDPADIPGFEISVVTSEAKPAASDDQFPTFAPFSTLPDVTHHKKGGLKLGARSFCDARS